MNHLVCSVAVLHVPRSACLSDTLYISMGEVQSHLVCCHVTPHTWYSSFPSAFPWVKFNPIWSVACPTHHTPCTFPWVNPSGLLQSCMPHTSMGEVQWSVAVPHTAHFHGHSHLVCGVCGVPSHTAHFHGQPSCLSHTPHTLHMSMGIPVAVLPHTPHPREVQSHLVVLHVPHTTSPAHPLHISMGEVHMGEVQSPSMGIYIIMGVSGYMAGMQHHCTCIVLSRYIHSIIIVHNNL